MPAQIEPKLSAEGVIWECFKYFAHQDAANAAMHLGVPRFSPITFRCAEQLQWRLQEVQSLTDGHLGSDWELLRTVLSELGTYPEDPGR